MSAPSRMHQAIQQTTCHCGFACTLQVAPPVQNYQTAALDGNPCDRLPPTQSPPTGGPPCLSPLFFSKREWLIPGRRHAKHIEDHRNQHVIAEDADQLDGRSVTEKRMHARQGLAVTRIANSESRGGTPVLNRQ